MADSVSIFAEGTFEEQVQELAEFISRSRPEAERQGFTSTFDDVLKTAESQKPLDEDLGRRQKIFSQVLDSVDGLGEGTDREIEGFFNLLSSHILALYSADSEEFASGISKIVNAASRQPHEHPSIKYRVLSNLFNAIPRTSSARLVVCTALLRLAAENEEVDALRLSPADANRWLGEWNVSAEDKSQFLKSVADAFTKTGNEEQGYTFRVSYVQSLPTSSSEPAALELIAMALRLPAVFNFDSLLKLDNVQAAKAAPLFALLNIVNGQGLDELRAWVRENESELSRYQLDATSLERKVRLLVLSQLGFSKIGQNVSYNEIASALQIQLSEVEKWVIDVIRAGLLSGKLSQVSQTLLVIRASPRGFSEEHWSALEKRLVAWKEGLAGVQAVLAAAQQPNAALGVNSLIPQEQTV